MPRSPSSCQLVVVDGLLSMLARRMYGALDLGLVLLLESPREGFPRFIAAHVASPMRALSAVLVLAVAEAQDVVATSPFEALIGDTERFLGALDELGQWQSLTPEAIRKEVELLHRSAGRINDTILDIGERLCFEPSTAKDFGPHRHESALAVIDSLPASLTTSTRAAERVSKQPGSVEDPPKAG